MNLNIAQLQHCLVDDECRTAQMSIADSVLALENMAADLKNMPVEISAEQFAGMFDSIVKTYKAVLGKFKTMSAIHHRKYVTEYANFIKSNQQLVAKVEALPFESIKDIAVDFPTGMKLKYPEVLDLVCKIFDLFWTNDSIGMASATVDRLLNMMSKEQPGYEKTLSAAAGVLATSCRALTDVHTVLMDNFDPEGKTLAKKKVSELFDPELTIAGVRAGLSGCDKQLAKAPWLNTKAEYLEKTLDLCVSYVEDRTSGVTKGYVPPKSFIEELANFILTIDKLFIMYGDAALVTMTISHNLVFVYKAIAKESA
jgi:hypothetical protein